MELPSNSDMSKRPADKPEPVEKVQRVTKTVAVQRKKTLGKRFSETFLGGDARGAGSYVMFDVLLPALRDMVADTVTMGIERMVYGDAARPRNSRVRGGVVGHTAYNRVSAGLRIDPREAAAQGRSRRAGHSFDDIVVDTRIEAEEVVNSMFNHLNKYEQVSLATLYDFVGIQWNYIDQKWGWVDLAGTDIRRTRDGYLLKFPPLVDL
jgi:hypothetical protein